MIDIDECATLNTPTGATQCAVQMANDKVAATLVPVSSQDGAIFNGLSGSGIPYVTYSAANTDIILKPGAFILTNPVGSIAAPGQIAKNKGDTKVGFILIDVPAATLKKATSFLDSVMDAANDGYGYTGVQSTPCPRPSTATFVYR